MASYNKLTVVVFFTVLKTFFVSCKIFIKRISNHIKHLLKHLQGQKIIKRMMYWTSETKHANMTNSEVGGMMGRGVEIWRKQHAICTKAVTHFFTKEHVSPVTENEQISAHMSQWGAVMKWMISKRTLSNFACSLAK